MKVLLMAGVSTLMLSTAAHAADVAASEVPPTDNLWYVSLFGGASLAHDVKTVVNGAAYSLDYSLDLNTGFVIGGAIGRRINDAFRVEGELSYARYKANSYTDWKGDTYSASGHLSATYLLANVWADVARFGQATIYAGGGLGAAYVTADTDFNGIGWGYGKGEWGVAGQLGAGVTYAVAQNIDLDFGYRFKAVSGIAFEDINAAYDEPYTGGDLYTHNLQLGITAKF
ncbi:outer membrane protein [Mesorhizobium sp. ANAO-SY3R2]|uniref:outer membrane protein n=1 Tax=Mesorhizobium sp. ANAO-SY3R2 TaxID=3166644 RepID=UPI00366E9BBC